MNFIKTIHYKNYNRLFIFGCIIIYHLVSAFKNLNERDDMFLT